MDDVVTFKSRLVCESKPGDVDRLDYCLRKNWGLNKNLQNVSHFENSASLPGIGELFRLLKFPSACRFASSFRQLRYSQIFFAFLEEFVDILRVALCSVTG